MKFTALKTFTHDELGRIEEGKEVEATELQAVTPVALGYFAPYKTKVVREMPEDHETKEEVEQETAATRGRPKTKK